MSRDTPHYQRGDSEGLLVCILLCFVLFWGDPDVWDALQKWAQTTVNPPKIEAKK